MARQRSTLWIPVALVTLVASAGARAQEPPPGVPGSLKDARVEPVPGIGAFVRNTALGVVLGKAFFWDMQAGSDGQACASCHFAAGTDPRIKNQLNPGHDNMFGPTNAGAGGPNYTLRSDDFPFHEKVNLLDRSSAPGNVAFDSNDRASSQGVFRANFLGVFTLPPAGNPFGDSCTPVADPDFQVDGYNVRRVEPRNTPTVINAGLNHRNFWDGRANKIFNGVDPFGKRSSKTVWKRTTVNGVKKIVKVKVALDNSSLASQAVGPPLSFFEMSCLNRTFPDIGKKMRLRQPLAFQAIHPQDSVLAPYRQADGTGLNTTYSTYEKLIKAVFKPEWWDYGSKVDGTFYQIEANFSLFWGIAIQLYEQTLKSDQAPWDRFRGDSVTPPDPGALTAQEQRGLEVFMGQGRCINCHGTAMFTNASTLHLIGEEQEQGLVERMLPGEQVRGPVLYDNGFYNIGVRPSAEDLGVGGADPFGNSLSFTRQYIDKLRGRNVPDAFQINECRFEIRFAPESAGDLDGNGQDEPFPWGTLADEVLCPSGTLIQQEDAILFGYDGESFYPDWESRDPNITYRPLAPDSTLSKLPTAVRGAFKTSTLRNIAWTGPYMHNGGMSTLAQVVDFYNRGGDFADQNGSTLDPDITPLGLTAQQQEDLEAFLDRPLTDPRVTDESGVFDHPQLFVPNGHPGDHDMLACVQGVPLKACDDLLEVPAVGQLGRAAQGLPPLQRFEEILP